MKQLFGFAAILLLSAASATAGDGRLSYQSLGKIGLGGMTSLSDAQGMEIRGLGVYDEGSSYEKGEKGEKYNHHKGEEKKCHEGKCNEKCGHEEKCCGQSGCHIETLCGHLQTSCHTH
jgi:hypothetical protein